MSEAVERPSANALSRFLGGFDDPRSRVVRGGRIAAVAFIAGGLIAIPANLLIAPEDDVVYLMPLLALVPGVICLFIPWDETPPWTLDLAAALAVALIALSMAVASPAYATYYVFVVLFVALVFRNPRVVMSHLLLVAVGLFVPVVVGSFTGRETLIIALLEAPSLVVVGTITAYLTNRLEESREAYWTLSRRDELTGVGNYRALHERLREEIARHGRSERPFALILFDLDGFKRINDRLGHLGGDKVLAQVGAALREGVRTGDLVFRQGGDEFAVIAPDTGESDAEDLAARLRIRLQDGGGAAIGISSPTGVAIFPGDGATSDDLLGIADLRLLGGKRERAADRSAAEPGLEA
ncbi:MAG: GGDEF domain-containing protein [Solirubrobacterales bacterium]